MNDDVKCAVKSSGVSPTRYTQNKRRRLTKIKQNTDILMEYTNSHLSFDDERVTFTAFFKYSEMLFVTIREFSCTCRVVKI